MPYFGPGLKRTGKDMSTRMPEFRRDTISIVTNCLAFAAVVLFSGGLWMLVR